MWYLQRQDARRNVKGKRFRSQCKLSGELTPQHVLIPCCSEQADGFQGNSTIFPCSRGLKTIGSQCLLIWNKTTYYLICWHGHLQAAEPFKFFIFNFLMWFTVWHIDLQILYAGIADEVLIFKYIMERCNMYQSFEPFFTPNIYNARVILEKWVVFRAA